MEEYLRILLEQIRCRQAHGAIRDEMEAHIRQQIEDNIASGMSMEQAEKAAVLDMGSPVETGIALDRIHRPQIAWKMILFITAITIAASVMHILLGTQEYVCGAAVGLVLMIFMYRLDYTRIAEFAKPVAVLLLITVSVCLHMGETMYGVTQSVQVGGIEISFFPLMLFYVPLYAAIIYSYYGSGYQGLAKAVIWMILPIIAALRMPSLALAAILLAAQAVVLTIAVGKGWYHIAKEKTLVGLWGTVLGLPILGFVQKYVMGGAANYQVMRIRIILTGQKEWDYTAKTAVDGIRSSVWIGDSGQNISANLPGGDSQFVLELWIRCRHLDLCRSRISYHTFFYDCGTSAQSAWHGDGSWLYNGDHAEWRDQYCAKYGNDTICPVVSSVFFSWEYESGRKLYAGRHCT